MRSSASERPRKRTVQDSEIPCAQETHYSHGSYSGNLPPMANLYVQQPFAGSHAKAGRQSKNTATKPAESKEWKVPWITPQYIQGNDVEADDDTHLRRLIGKTCF